MPEISIVNYNWRDNRPNQDNELIQYTSKQIFQFLLKLQISKIHLNNIANEERVCEWELNNTLDIFYSISETKVRTGTNHRSCGRGNSIKMAMVFDLNQ